MNRYLARKTVAERLGVSAMTIWRWVRDGRFPSPIRLGPRRTAWKETDIVKWEETRQAVKYGMKESSG
jgi:prophage regulatory protein